MASGNRWTSQGHWTRLGVASVALQWPAHPMESSEAAAASKAPHFFSGQGYSSVQMGHTGNVPYNVAFVCCSVGCDIIPLNTSGVADLLCLQPEWCLLCGPACTLPPREVTEIYISPYPLPDSVLRCLCLRLLCRPPAQHLIQTCPAEVFLITEMEVPWTSLAAPDRKLKTMSVSGSSLVLVLRGR